MPTPGLIMYAIVSYEYIRLDLRMFSHLFFSSFYLFTPDSFTLLNLLLNRK